MNTSWGRVATIVISLIVIGAFGFFWYQQSQLAPEPEPEQPTLADWVDRGIKPEDLERQQQKIADVQQQIADLQAAGDEDISLYLRLGNLYYGIGELKLAADQYLYILSGHPTDAPALENLAQVQVERGDYAGAEASWRAALLTEPYEPTYLKLADLITEHFPDRQAEVQPLLEDAIATLGQSVGLLTHLGDWYADNGMYDEAISHYEVALQLDPDNEGLKNDLDDLRALRTKETK
jgi:tetratricopeptide (TPR) repeat protein